MKGYDDPVLAARDSRAGLMMVTLEQLERGYAVREEDGTVTMRRFVLIYTEPERQRAVVRAPQSHVAR